MGYVLSYSQKYCKQGPTNKNSISTLGFSKIGFILFAGTCENLRIMGILPNKSKNTAFQKSSLMLKIHEKGVKCIP